MSGASDALGSVVSAVEANPVPIFEAGASLIGTIVTLIKSASSAKAAQRDGILAALQAADAALSGELDGAHKALADEIALDDAAIKAAEAAKPQ